MFTLSVKIPQISKQLYKDVEIGLYGEVDGTIDEPRGILYGNEKLNLQNKNNIHFVPHIMHDE